MKSGDFESTHVLLNKIPVRNLITWNAMITGFEANEKFKEAFELFETMLDGDVFPFSFWSRAVVMLLKKMENIDVVLVMLLKKMENIDVVLVMLLKKMKTWIDEDELN
ncbi:hypothetical protein ACOSQ4_029393 [Xanthoceras sorbifolium]